MKQLVVLSGKGGTGKTSLTAACAHLAHESTSIRTVLADADVDAANLELVLAPQIQETYDFIGGSVAHIDSDLCGGCGTCASVCRFDAITQVQTPDGVAYQVDEIACEGCAACFYQCPSQAIRIEPQHAGLWFRSDSRYGPLVHAALRPAQENSGKLVTLVKQHAQVLGREHGYDLLLVDGPPGIACAAIAASSGADLALIVSEPTNSGLHDLERILETTAHFRVPALVCINKADLYAEGVQQLHAYCKKHAIEVVGEIPFDDAVHSAMLRGEPVTAWQPDAAVSTAIAAIWQRVCTRLWG